MRVRVEGVQVLLAGAVEPLRLGIDPLLNGGVRDLFDETQIFKSGASLGLRPGALRSGGAGS